MPCIFYIFQVKKNCYATLKKTFKKLLDTHNLDRLISIYTVGILNLRINTLSLHLSYSLSKPCHAE